MTATFTPRPAKPEDVPAVIHDYSSGRFKIAAVSHPAGPWHENAQRARARLVAKGFTLVPLRTSHAEDT